MTFRPVLAIGIMGIGLVTCSSVPSAQATTTSSRPASLLKRAIPSLPQGFHANPRDPWGHKMGSQTASQFLKAEVPDWNPPGEFQSGAILDAYDEFASAKTHKKSDYLTVSLVRLVNENQTAELTSQMEGALTIGLTPAPRGGSVKEVRVPGLRASRAYESWFEGSASFDIVFSRGDVVVELERTSPSKAVVTTCKRFADQLYRRLAFSTTRFT